MIYTCCFPVVITCTLMRLPFLRCASLHSSCTDPLLPSRPSFLSFVHAAHLLLLTREVLSCAPFLGQQAPNTHMWIIPSHEAMVIGGGAIYAAVSLLKKNFLAHLLLLPTLRTLFLVFCFWQCFLHRSLIPYLEEFLDYKTLVT